MKNNNGFSLVELIVVIAILATVISVIALQFGKYIKSSKASTDFQNLQEIKTMVEVYYTDNDVDRTGTFELENNGVNITIVCNDKNAIFNNSAIDIDNIKLKSKDWLNIKMKYVPSTNEWIMSGTNSVDSNRYDLSMLKN